MFAGQADLNLARFAVAQGVAQRLSGDIGQLHRLKGRRLL
jgi:hypothetical protein